MLFVTGDTHGEHHRFLKGQNSTDRLSSGDMLIVCGDFGYIFRGGEKEEEMPADEEIIEAIGNLKKNNHQVDDIVTHAAPEDTMCLFHPYHP